MLRRPEGIKQDKKEIMIPNVLTIAGSDPSGGAGIQADLKTFSALGCYGMSVITALTAQNTQGVSEVHELPAAFVEQQIRAVFEDIRVDAVKIGMVGSSQTIQALTDAILKYKPPYVVLDPVMIAGSGDQLISDRAIMGLKTHLAPLANVITPNIPEAEIFLERPYAGDMEDMALGLLKLESRAVLLTGGHLSGKICKDVFADKDEVLAFEEDRVETNNTHGTGCTLSAALAAYMAKGLPASEAARAAKKYLSGALRHADRLNVGRGAGPVNHFYRVWGDERI